MDSNRTPMPFYMTETYQRMINNKPEDGSRRMQERSERDYFRQMYPENIKRYLRIIAEVINPIDARGSFLYDEYPDNIRLERLTETVLRLIPLEKHMNRETQRNIIRILLYDEVMWRRKREFGQEG